MKFQGTAFKILNEFKEVFNGIDRKEVEDLAEIITRVKRVFIVGAGREGLSSRAFAMRLMHLGKIVYWVWGDTTPNIGRGDLLIANCGNGNIVSVYHVAQKAKQAGASVATITTNPEGNMAKLSEVVVHLPAEVWGGGIDAVSSIQPMGCLFEQSLLNFGRYYSFNIDGEDGRLSRNDE